MKRLLLLTAIFLSLFISCSKEGTTPTNNAINSYIGTWQCIDETYLVITKVDDETLNLKRVHLWGRKLEKDITYIAYMDDDKIILPDQHDITRGSGYLVGSNRLSIDYYYGQTSSRLGVTYTKIENPSTIPVYVDVSLPGTTWKCTSGTPWPSDLEYWSFKFNTAVGVNYGYLDVLFKKVGYAVQSHPENPHIWSFWPYDNGVTISSSGMVMLFDGWISNDGKSMEITGKLTNTSGTYLFIRQ